MSVRATNQSSVGLTLDNREGAPWSRSVMGGVWAPSIAMNNVVAARDDISVRTRHLFASIIEGNQWWYPCLVGRTKKYALCTQYPLFHFPIEFEGLKNLVVVRKVSLDVTRSGRVVDMVPLDAYLCGNSPLSARSSRVSTHLDSALLRRRYNSRLLYFYQDSAFLLARRRAHKFSQEMRERSLIETRQD